MEIAYKVVGRERRYGSNATGFEWNISSTLDEFFSKHPLEEKWLKPYFPIYTKGSIIRCVPGSAGILCFEDWHYADVFKRRHKSLEQTAIIIQVQGFARKAKVPEIISSCMLDIRNLTLDYKDMCPYNYDGVVAYNAVKVLE